MSVVNHVSACVVCVCVCVRLRRTVFCGLERRSSWGDGEGRRRDDGSQKEGETGAEY